MSIGPGAAKIGVPYLVEYEGEQWTGIRFRHVRPLSMGMLPPHLWQKETGTTAWIFLRYENDTGLISQQVMYAEDQAFGEIVPLVPSRNVTREEAHLTAEEAKAAHDNWMAASKRADRAEGKLYEARKDAEWYRNLALKGDQYAEELITERDELQSKLDAVEDQRVEEQAKALYCTLNPGRPMAWRQLAEDERENCRAAIRAGWTPPESEA